MCPLLCSSQISQKWIEREETHKGICSIACFWFRLQQHYLNNTNATKANKVLILEFTFCVLSYVKKWLPLMVTKGHFTDMKSWCFFSQSFTINTCELTEGQALNHPRAQSHQQAKIRDRAKHWDKVKSCFHLCQFPWFVASRDTHDCCSVARSVLPELKYHRGTILQCVPSLYDRPALLLIVSDTIPFRKDFSSSYLWRDGVSPYFCHYRSDDLPQLSHKGTICTVFYCDVMNVTMIIKRYNEFSLTLWAQRKQ